VQHRDYDGMTSGVDSEKTLALERAMNKGKQAGEMYFVTNTLPRLVAEKKIVITEVGRALGQDAEQLLQDAVAGRIKSTVEAGRFRVRGKGSDTEINVPTMKKQGVSL
jgi:hypothetical protein